MFGVENEAFWLKWKRAATWRLATTQHIVEICVEKHSQTGWLMLVLPSKPYEKQGQGETRPSYSDRNSQNTRCMRERAIRINRLFSMVFSQKQRPLYSVCHSDVNVESSTRTYKDITKLRERWSLFIRRQKIFCDCSTISSCWSCRLEVKKEISHKIFVFWFMLES